MIFNEAGEILLEKRSDNGFWGLPGGGVEAGESVREAVIREVLEETGLHVEVKRLVGVYSDPREYTIVNYAGGQSVQYVTVVFECQRKSGTLRISNESTDLANFAPELLPEVMLPAHRLRVEDAVANRVEAFIR